jgi:hypothetical protein
MRSLSPGDMALGEPVSVGAPPSACGPRLSTARPMHQARV